MDKKQSEMPFLTLANMLLRLLILRIRIKYKRSLVKSFKKDYKLSTD